MIKKIEREARRENPNQPGYCQRFLKPVTWELEGRVTWELEGRVDDRVWVDVRNMVFSEVARRLGDD